MVTDWQRIKALRLAASSCAGLSLALAAGAQPASRPNVVFILIDDMGAGDIGCYGSDFYETPNIDSWASQSVRFSSAYASCHVSSPARASLLTGMYPASTGVTDWLPGRREYPFQRSSTTRVEQDLPESLPNMARTFSEAGYATALVGSGIWARQDAGRPNTALTSISPRAI